MRKTTQFSFLILGTHELASDIFPNKTLHLRNPKSFCPFQTNCRRALQANISTYKLIQHQGSQEAHTPETRISVSEKDPKGTQYLFFSMQAPPQQNHTRQVAWCQPSSLGIVQTKQRPETFRNHKCINQDIININLPYTSIQVF